jgi:hypothetical protein
MAIILYGNGLTEEISPTQFTFSDEEILQFFNEFKDIQTKRLDEIPNTWCVWGELENPEEDDYNKLASEIIQYHCYSKLLLLHDTEVDPSWNLTDLIIYDGYDLFKKKILQFLDQIAIETIKEIEQIREESGKPKLMALEQVAISMDKRVIFKFDPDKQQKDFYNPMIFAEWANKSFNFIDSSYKDGEIFPIFADKKMIMILEDFHVKRYMDLLMKFFEVKEEYLKCARITEIYKNWEKYKAKKKPKRGRPKKKKEDDPSAS